MIHTGIASLAVVLTFGLLCVWTRESPIGRYVFGSGGSPIDVSP